MNWNFDEIIDRRNTNALNTDGFRSYIFHTGPEKVFPYKDEEFVRMWVADMEFATPPEICDAIKERVDKRIFGYTQVFDNMYYTAFLNWCQKHYDWSFPQEELVFSTGIIPALYELAEELVAKGMIPVFRFMIAGAFCLYEFSIFSPYFDAIPLTQNYILQLHKILYSRMNNPMAGRTKSVQNYISATYPDGHVETLFTPLAPYETPEALDRICEEYNRVIGNMEVEPLIAIPIFIHDFLCIHPFNDGNGRMSRLLTTLLLYRNGFHVEKYISLEAKIEKNKDLYYDALGQAQTG